MNTKLNQIIQLHANLREENPYCYFELAYTRSTEWMVWICSNSREDDPNRIILAKGQGQSPEEAAEMALLEYQNQEPGTKN